MMNFAKCLLVVTLLFSSAFARCGVAEDANAVVETWSAAYSSNEPDRIVGNYWPDAILLGTVSPVMSEGTAAIQQYFSAVKGTGNKNTLGNRRTIVLSDDAAVVTGFYTFTRMSEGQPAPRPSRFTMLVVKRGSEWRIAHHHSSPHVQPN